MIYIECQINTIDNLLTLIIKSEDDEFAAFFAKYIEQIFVSSGYI